jgi:hypothetical protein
MAQWATLVISSLAGFGLRLAVMIWDIKLPAWRPD